MTDSQARAELGPFLRPDITVVLQVPVSAADLHRVTAVRSAAGTASSG